MVSARGRPGARAWREGARRTLLRGQAEPKSVQARPSPHDFDVDPLTPQAHIACAKLTLRRAQALAATVVRANGPARRLGEAAISLTTFAAQMSPERQLPGDLPDGLLITPAHSFNYFTNQMEALRQEAATLKHQAENMNVRARDHHQEFMLGMSGDDIEALLNAIIKRIPNKEAWSELHILDIFTPSLEDRKARTFQDSLLKACNGMLQEGARMRAGTSTEGLLVSSGGGLSNSCSSSPF